MTDNTFFACGASYALSRRSLLVAGLGAHITAASPERIYFRCPDGLGVELLSVDPVRIWGLA